MFRHKPQFKPFLIDLRTPSAPIPDIIYKNTFNNYETKYKELLTSTYSMSLINNVPKNTAIYPLRAVLLLY